MGFYFGGTQANVALSGTVSTTLSNETVVVLSDAQGGPGTKTLGTVPANKVWRVAWVQVTAGAGAVAGNGSVQVNGTKICNIVISAANSHTNSAMAFQRGVRPTATAGQTITLVVEAGSTNLTCVCSVGYVEEAV